MPDVTNSAPPQTIMKRTKKATVPRKFRMGTRTVWTNQRLTQLYATYNLAYFKAKLPEFDVFIADLHPASLLLYRPYGRCDFEQRRILITVQFHIDDFDVTSTLLHEMAHVLRLTVADDGDHGPDWQAEIRRLWRAGAPVYKNGSEYDRISGWDIRYDNPEDDPFQWDEDDPRFFEEEHPDEVSEDGFWSGLLVSNLREARPGERLKRKDL